MKTTTTSGAALLLSLLLFGFICVTFAEVSKDSTEGGNENDHLHDNDHSEDHDEVATLVIICVIAAIAFIVFIALGLLLIFCCCVGLAYQQSHRPRAVVVQVPRHSSPLRPGNHYSTEASPLVTFHPGTFQEQPIVNFTPSSSLMSHLPPQNYAYNPQAQPHKEASFNHKRNAL